jgi:membrane-associated protease RseP (regulator of RpoE activity)
MKTPPSPALIALAALGLVAVEPGLALSLAIAGAAITIVVGLHELAHLVVARSLGIRVERYAIGFGPRLVARTARGISWELRMLPLGGFVELHGERDDAGEGSFSRASLPARIAVIGAGPVSSLLAAPLLCAIPFLVGGLDPVTAIGKGIELCSVILRLTGDAIAGWLPNAASDPLAIPFSGLPGIAYAAGAIADEGPGVFFAFAGALSLSAGLLNALPIPPLDGGRIAFALLRHVAPVRGERLEQGVAFIGVVALLGLGAVLALVDLVRIGNGSFPSA